MKDKLFYGLITVAILLAASCEKQELDCDCTRYERITYLSDAGGKVNNVFVSMPMQVECQDEQLTWKSYQTERTGAYLKVYDYRIECD